MALTLLVYASRSMMLIGRTLAKFNQPKRNKRFDNFIMFVWVQESLFHIAVGSNPVQEALGSQDSTEVKFKSCFIAVKNIPTESTCFNDPGKV